MGNPCIWWGELSSPPSAAAPGKALTIPDTHTETAAHGPVELRVVCSLGKSPALSKDRSEKVCLVQGLSRGPWPGSEGDGREARDAGHLPYSEARDSSW